MSDNGFNWVGKPRRRVDGRAKVTGQTQFADDIFMPRMVHGKLLRSSVPHAVIKKVDTARAQRYPGVHLVLTGKDLPNEYGILPVSQDEQALRTERVRYVGDPVAAVIAKDELTAFEAMDLIDVEYEPLRTISSPRDALENPEPRLHEYSEDGNIHRRLAYSFGDVDEALAGSDHVFEDVFYFEGNTHLPIEQHACVAAQDRDGKLTLWSSTQVPHYLHRALAKTLELPTTHFRVVACPNGGGFGGKTDPFQHEIVAAKAAMMLGRPVKICLTREEVFYCHRGRHPVLMKFRTGVTNDGKLTGMHLQTLLDGGGYGSYGIASSFYTAVLQPVTYRLPRYRFETCRTFTNKPPCGPKRGHGTPQPRFGQEVQLDKIAEKLEMDPAELRLGIVEQPNTLTANYLKIGTIGLAECIRRVVERSDWKDKYRKLPEGHGIGIACSAYLTGAGTAIYWNKMPHSGVQLQLDRSGRVALFCGATEIGQGSDDMLALMVAEILGIDPITIRCVTGDTDVTPVDLGSYSSRVTLMAGNAAIQAAERARALIAEAVAQRMELPADVLVFANDRVFASHDSDKGMSFADACVCAEEKHGTLGAVGSYAPPRHPGHFKGAGVGPSPAYSYTACVLETEVDPDTGWITVPRVYIAHDVGRSLNPTLVRGQIEGSVYMGLGEALMEEQVFRRLPAKLSGALVHKFPSMLEYKSLTSHDMPEVITDVIEDPDDNGPFGGKEAGQGPLLPVMPALANAVYDAVGVRVDEIPVTPDKVLKALEQKRAGKDPRVGPKDFPDIPFPEPYMVTPPAEGGDGTASNDPDRKRASKMHQMDRVAAQ